MRQGFAPADLRFTLERDGEPGLVDQEHTRQAGSKDTKLDRSSAAARPAPVHMKLLTITLLICASFGMNSVFAEGSSPWHSFIGVGGGIYDSSESYLGVVEGGIGYEAGPLIHYLFVGGGQVYRDKEEGASIGPFGGARSPDSNPDLDQFEFGYLVAYRLNEKASAFAEIGAESFSGSSDGVDVLGNPYSVSFNSNHIFLGAGFRMEVWNGINLDFSCRYLPNIDEAAFSRTILDALGNLRQVEGDTPHFLVKCGISYWF